MANLTGRFLTQKDMSSTHTSRVVPKGKPKGDLQTQGAIADDSRMSSKGPKENTRTPATPRNFTRAALETESVRKKVRDGLVEDGTLPTFTPKQIAQLLKAQITRDEKSQARPEIAK